MISLYAMWKGLSEREIDLQSSATPAGQLGRLNENWDGPQPPTQCLCPEVFASNDRSAEIPPSFLRAGLDKVAAAIESHLRPYYSKTLEDEVDERFADYANFVELCEEKETAGVPVTIVAR